ncbi:uncharacterized protein LOC123015507 [Tribolium madens]|uniref:uncharacterized protein LOC123015507 n=1 Tax=Tribolium madens TaxID=41895 RepID=UPI001CF73357|nr:uncharacterized protein LOC123015507 [Tribolium madens]
MNDSNSREIQRVQSHLKTLFRAFIQVTDATLRRKSQQLLGDLEKFECDVPLPELTQFAGELPASSVDERKLRNEILKVIQLLQILINKVDCPISRIIDKI